MANLIPQGNVATSLCCFEGDEVVNELGYGAARVLAAPPALTAQNSFDDVGPTAVYLPLIHRYTLSKVTLCSVSAETSRC
jgi:hypothetical protein